MTPLHHAAATKLKISESMRRYHQRYRLAKELARAAEVTA